MKALQDIRARLEAATDAELELSGTEPSMSGQHFSIRRKGVPGLRISGHEYGHGGAYTDMILNAPTDLAKLLNAVEAVLARADAWEAAFRVDRTGPGRDVAADFRAALTSALGEGE